MATLEEDAVAFLKKVAEDMLDVYSGNTDGATYVEEAEEILIKHGQLPGPEPCGCTLNRFCRTHGMFAPEEKS
jgi:hypothetical protein